MSAIVQIFMLVVLGVVCSSVYSKSVPLERGAGSRDFIRPTLQAQESQYRPEYAEQGDLQSAASGHGHHGRVQIKVYRGPSDGHHAAHGFWVKQPADDDHH